MTGILSRHVPAFDISSTGFRGAAGDLGEVIALLAGGVRPDPETISRLAISLRALQGFLLNEAQQQEGREAVLRCAVAEIAAEYPLCHRRLLQDQHSRPRHAGFRAGASGVEIADRRLPP